MDVAHRRSIRSFVRRTGRLTDGQQQAIERLWPHFGLPADQSVDLAAVFARTAPCVLDIGFGNGDALLAQALKAPEHNFLGIDVHRPGIGHLLLQLEAHQCHNVRVLERDALDVLRDLLPPACLSALQIFFPDPWPKKRHHKRRLIRPDTIPLFAQALQPDGLLHAATDCPDYARQMLDLLDASADFVNIAGAGCYVPRPDWRPLTRFEQRGLRLGQPAHDLCFRRTGPRLPACG